MNIEHNPSNEKRSSFTLDQYTLPELQANPQLYESFLITYCDVFNSPPWNENWTPDGVAGVLSDEIDNDDNIFLARQDDSIVGFSWGKQANVGKIVPMAFDAYLFNDSITDNIDNKPYDRENLMAEVMLGLERQGFTEKDLIFYGCELGIVPDKRGSFQGSKIAYELFNTLIKIQLEDGMAQHIFTLTRRDSAIYKMFTKKYRASIVLLDLQEYCNNKDIEPYVFMLKDMKEIFR